MYSWNHRTLQLQWHRSVIILFRICKLLEDFSLKYNYIYNQCHVFSSWISWKFSILCVCSLICFKLKAMGASQHKVGSPKTQLSTYQHATPPREPGITKRQLPFDPRSPTDNIARTPIIVDKTPDALLGLDPRSPTVGIERTPLSVLLSKGNYGCTTKIVLSCRVSCVISYIYININEIDMHLQNSLIYYK